MANTTLEAKKVIIIGGTSGIGLAVAEAAAREGARVVVASSQAANVEVAVKRLGGSASGSAIDVNNEEDLRRLFMDVGPVDHLVYSAGDWARTGGGALADLDLAAAAKGFAVRFWGALAMVKHGYPQIAAGGSIVLTDGLYAHRPVKGGAVGSAMLGAIEHLTRALAVDLAPIRVNAVCPGLVLTERNKKVMSEDLMRRFTASQPLPRAADPEEVAQAYLYLMRGGYTTGQVLIVDGGRTLV